MNNKQLQEEITNKLKGMAPEEQLGFLENMKDVLSETNKLSQDYLESLKKLKHA